MHYSDFIIMSDVDGTLILRGGIIPERNVAAINRFVNAGGRFAIASGRSPMWVKSFVEQLPVNAPCVLINGSVLYDFAKEEYLWQIPLPEYAKAYVEQLGDLSRKVGMVVMTRDGYYNIKNETELVMSLMKKRNAKFAEPVCWRDIGENWFKLLLLVPDECFESTMETLRGKNLPGVVFTPSDRMLIEMMPEGVNKGVALKKLSELFGCGLERFAAIGDFYNDVEMIKAAGVGATIMDAPEDIKSHAKLLTCACEDGAVADLIEYLERTYR